MSTDTETDFDQGIFTDPKIDNVQQMENDLQNINPLDLLSSNEVLDNVKIYDSTVEIVGYVDGIESPRLVGDKQQYKIFKFFLNNASGRRVQVVAWNEEIKIVESAIIPNHIVHLDGVQARAPKHANFNNGNVAYELHIKSNSIINTLGKYEPISSSSHGPIPILLKDVMNSSGYIQLESFIKTNFSEMYNNLVNKIIGYGSVTDGIYKLEVRITNFNKDDYTDLNINKGDKIQIIGSIRNKDPE